jgi:hypothetical protein
MVWKVINISDSGTSIKFGADDLDKVNKQLSGIDMDLVKIPVNYVDLKAIAVPSSPSAGYVRLFVDTADGKTKIKRSDGSVVLIE